MISYNIKIDATYVTNLGTSAMLGYRFTQTSTILSKLVVRCLSGPIKCVHKKLHFYVFLTFLFCILHIFFRIKLQIKGICNVITNSQFLNSFK